MYLHNARGLMLRSFTPIVRNVKSTPIVRNVKSELTIGPPLCMGDFGLNLLLDASTRMESIHFAIGDLW